MKENNKERTATVPKRRTFLTKLWIGLGFVALAQLVTGGVLFFISGRKRDSDTPLGLLVDAGAVTEFLPGTVTFIQAGNCYLSRLDGGGFLAISRKCTHLGCAVPWVGERKQFECPCHASIFDRTGNVMQSPAPRALDLYPISFENDRIKIDISHPIRRTEFSSGQLAHPQELG